MKIRRATKEDIQQLYEFNHRMYPERKNCKEIIDFWLSKRDDEINNIVIIVDDDNEIKGQQFFSTMSYFYKNSEHESTWAFDLIVDEELRAGSHGFSLMWKCKKEHPNSMSSGSNDISLPINLKIGNKHIGNLKKYVGITNPFFLITSFFRGALSKDNFPKKIVVNNITFEKIKEVSEIPNYISCFNKDLLEISRKQDFIKWRFFSNLHEYVFYHNRTNNDYFVLRTIVKHKITMLVLVDFRCNINDENSFENIMIAFRKIARKMKIAAIIAGSSLEKTDEICEKYKMKRVGRDRPILGMIDCDNCEDKIKNRNYIYITLADSDGDITW